ncbi:MAG TPA: pyridoxamine 5'-phosphate oxidase family protein [Rhizomicrobium sp.]|nr:pyridoxamine 5'-phosphate oxidase family protein [Rhizomicrobium sp.]
MEVHSLDNRELEKMLATASLGRLACVSEGQPYIALLYFGFDEGYLYSFTTMGRKIEWMRENPRVCVAFDEIRSAWDWTSVILFGEYEELKETEPHQPLREHAYKLLQQKRALWWEPGYVRTKLGDRERQLDPVYFRIRVTEMTGRRGVRDGKRTGMRG